MNILNIITIIILLYKKDKDYLIEFFTLLSFSFVIFNWLNLMLLINYYWVIFLIFIIIDKLNICS